ncbi:MAG: hypothetical protein AAGJ18_29490, partial [Bacteroidota bacterium]
MKITQILFLPLLFFLLLFACNTPSTVIQAPTSTEVKEEVSEATEKPMATADNSPAIPMDDRVRKGQLPNGLKYFIQKNGKPENRAELRLAVAAGSMQED